MASSLSFRAEEFEFQWWDHAFNKAAKSVKVEEGQDGQVKVGLPLSSAQSWFLCVLIFTSYTKFQHLSLDLQVDFNSSKNELSTKKIRRKAEKAMKKEVIGQLDGLS